MKTPNPDQPIRNSLKHLALGAVAVLAFAIPAAHADLVVNVDFGSGAAYSGLGVAPDTGTTWNSFAAGVSSAPLVDSINASTSVTLTADGSTFNSGSVGALLSDYFYTNFSTSNVTLSGLTAGAQYSFYLYGNGDQTNQSTTFTFAAANGGAVGSTTGSDRSNINSTFVNLNATADSGGVISFTWTAKAGTQFGVLNGFQMVQTSGTSPIPVISSLSPADNATGVTVNANLVATFNKDIAKGTAGNITIRKLTSPMSDTTIPIDNAQVSVSGRVLTINPESDLLPNTDYAVLIDSGAIIAVSDSTPFAGITDQTTWNFTVPPPLVITPPPVTAGLKLHLDASALTGMSDGATVNTWSDVSGSAPANNATRTAGAPTYETNELNGKPVVRFNGSSTFTTANLSAQFPSAATVFVVATINDSGYSLVTTNPGTDEWWRWDGNGNSYPAVFRGSRIEQYGATPNSGTQLFAVTSSASAWEMAINGTSQGIASGNYNAGAAFVIGGDRSDKTFNGDMAEILMYDRVLSAGEADQVGGYLTAKYGLTTSYSGPASITAFGIPGSTGVINKAAKTIALTVPFGTNLATLAPTFTLSSGICNQTSGSPPTPTFASSNPATYTVTDGATVNNYAVTVTVTPVSTARAMLTCDFGALGQAVIDEAAGTALLTVSPGQSVTALAPTFTLSPFATINPASGSTRNFTSPVVYRVTAQDGISFKDYTVSVQTFATWAHSGSMFILTTPDGANMTTGPAETNFPLLVRFNSGNFPFNQAAADGSDIRFTTATGLLLSYQIEQWDAVNGRAAVWVKIPSIAPNARQEIKMYWGKAGVASQSNGSAVFNTANGYASVHHMADTLADTVGTTSPSNSGTTATNGLIGRSRTFAAGQGIQCGTSITGLPSGTAPLSTGVWVRPSAFGKVVLGWGLESTGNKVVMNLASPPSISMDCNFGAADVRGSTAIPSSEWSYIVHTFQTTGTRLYVNGVLDASNNGGVMNIATPCRFDIGGFLPTSSTFNFVGDMDEVRISNVARSANWVKLEYENQKPLQTLVGGLVPSGSSFSVTPNPVTMNEAATTTLTAQAGGAQKVYWILKKNGQETVLATDLLTFNYTAPRITGNDSAVIQFKAVFASDTQMIDLPLDVIEAVPDPVFTLVPSTTSWDGRSTMTVTANISNLAAMQAAGFGTLNYKWSVNGVAVTKQTSNGTLTLTRSQGSGPLNVSLTIDNGGTPVSQSTVINVQEPASDPWVERTPGATEKPVNGQFFARNPSTGLGTIFYNGTQSGSPNSVFLKVYRTPNGGSETLETERRQALVGGAYAFTAPITAGLNTYRVVYGTTTGGTDTNVATVTDLVCGDAFIIEGQSNALATDNSAPNDTTTTNKWIRTYGLTSGWGYAISKGNDRQLGLWGWYLANRLVTNHSMPICIINGAAGGTRIDMHRPNPTNHALPLGTGWSEDIYANLYNRVTGAKLTHGIRGLLWHQGEQDQGAIGIDGDYNYKFYQQYFVDISAAWKQDFPNLGNYYLFQIWPAACGETSRNDQLREVQRTLPYLYSNMKIMSTHGIVPGSGCHYEPAGYQVFSDLIGPLVEQDVYGEMPTANLTAPNLQRAYFTTPAKTEIALVFDQNVAWNPGAPTMLFLADAAGATSGTVSSGSATGNTIKLQVSGATNATAITYLKGLVSWQQANLLYGSNGIAALTFADVPIAAPAPYESWAAGSFANAFTDKDPSHDPDIDGMTNQEEFAFGLDPTTGSSVNPITQQLDKATGIFKYTRTKDSGLTYKVYYSTNLSGWTLDAAATQSAAAVAGIETVTVTLAPAVPRGDKLFVRVEATPAP